MSRVLESRAQRKRLASSLSSSSSWSSSRASESRAGALVVVVLGDVYFYWRPQRLGAGGRRSSSSVSHRCAHLSSSASASASASRRRTSRAQEHLNSHIYTCETIVCLCIARSLAKPNHSPQTADDCAATAAANSTARCAPLQRRCERNKQFICIDLARPQRRASRQTRSATIRVTSPQLDHRLCRRQTCAQVQSPI